MRTIFTQPSLSGAADVQLQGVVTAIQKRWSDPAACLKAAEEILAYLAVPQEHWTRIYSTNPLKRLNKEVNRCTDVVGVFPDEVAVLRLVGALPVELHEEWQVGRRYFSQASCASSSNLNRWSCRHPRPSG